jgi:hypothetical protein
MKRGLQVMAQRFDALSLRDRLTLALGGLALLVGAEMLLVVPLQDKRVLLARAAADDAAAQAEQLRAAQAQRRAQWAELQARGVVVERQLAELGLDREASRNPSGFIVAAVHGTQATLVSLRGLPVESVSAAAAPGVEAAAAAASAPVGSALFRHRAELKLRGQVQDLTLALGLLEHGVAPLRIEQVLLSAGDAGRTLEATVTLTAINRERTWFAL